MLGRGAISSVAISGAQQQSDAVGARYSGGWEEFLTRPKRKDIPEAVEQIIEQVAAEKTESTVAVQKRAFKDAMQEKHLRYQEKYVVALREQVKYLKQAKRLQDDEQDEEEMLLLLMH